MTLPGAKSKGSLIRTTLIKMAVRIALVILGATAISYFHLVSILEVQTQEQLEKYIIERGQRESNIFTLATDNQAILKRELLKQLKKLANRDPQAEFDQLVTKWLDGTLRNAPQNQAKRKPTWIGLYFDRVVKLWMVTLATPVDDAKGRHIASIGNDIIMHELMERTIRDHLEGTYNLIFRADGRLIVHPDRMAQIQEKQGQFNILNSGDRQLNQIFQLARNS